MSTYDTDLYIDGILVPLRSALDYTESWDTESDPEDFTTWAGDTEIVDVLYRTKYVVTISASGAGVWRVPALTKVRPGEIITIHSRNPQTDVIPAGMTQCVLLRPPVPGSVAVVRADGKDEFFIPCTVDGRVVSIAAAIDEPVAVIYRPIMVCKVRRPLTQSVASVTGAVAWSIDMIEASAPQL